MPTNVAEGPREEKPSPTSSQQPRPARKERTAADGEASVATRFFLAKPGSNGTPAFDRELTTEGEAMIESLKSGLSYYCVAEYRAVADYSGKNPQVRKEAVKV